jgi:transglutaminase-like putative cysteine protease
MSLTRRLQISMAALVALGTVLLGLGQPTSIMPLLAIFAAGTSLLFTDVLGWFRLHRVVANLAAVAAAVFSLWNFFRDNSQEQLLSIANLLSILLMILLYQEKNDRLYWQIAVLSLLQVVVAAALNLGLLFGLLLLVYMLVAMTTLMLFFLHREAARLVAVESSSLSRGEPARAVSGETRGKPQERTAFFHAPAAAYQPVDRAALDRPFLGGRLLEQVASLGGTTLVFALILFYSVPRLSNATWQGPASGGQRLSGFSPQITFDQMGEILQNKELVMRVEFFDHQTGEPYHVENPYFRGAVLVDYEFDGESAQWAQSFSTSFRGARRMRVAPAETPLVRQEITFAGSGVTTEMGSEPPILFSTYPIYPVAETPSSLRFDFRTLQLFRAYSEEAVQTAQYRYELGTTAFRSGWPASITPHVGVPLDAAARTRLARYGHDRHAGLRELARRLLARDDLRGRSRRDQAQALEAHFLDPSAITLTETPKAYTYSLRPEGQRQPHLDPIEDFAVNHRSGHCEYFASALALMLRSQGIPCRVALGYKGGEFNSLGGYWQVRQLHAHAWVEVYLEPEDVPPDALAPGESAAEGGWLLLDPTPPSSLPAAVARGDNLLGKFLDVFDYAQFLWNDYVVGLNSETQKRTIYPPVDTDAPGSFSDLLSFDKWREFFARASRMAGIDPRAWLRGEWFSWRAGVVAMGLCLAVVGLVRLAGWMWSRGRGKQRRRHEGEKRRAGMHVEFYARLLELLARWGLERRPEQTQREFAAAAAARLAALPVGAEITAIPRQIVEVFYRVRFGGATLDNNEIQEIEQALTTLEKSVA